MENFLIVETFFKDCMGNKKMLIQNKKMLTCEFTVLKTSGSLNLEFGLAAKSLVDSG